MVKLNKMKPVSTKAKIPAFTLFESVIAISIITVLIGLGTVIYTNLIVSEHPVLYYQAKDQIDVQLNELRTSQAFFNRDFDFENYRIEQRVDLYNGNKRLYKVTFLAFTGTKELIKEQHFLAHE